MKKNKAVRIVLSFIAGISFFHAAEEARGETKKVGILPVDSPWSKKIELAICDEMLNEPGLEVTCASETRSLLKEKGILRDALECRHVACAARFGVALGFDLVVSARVDFKVQKTKRVPVLDVRVLRCKDANLEGSSKPRVISGDDPAGQVKKAVMEARHRRAELSPEEGAISGMPQTTVDRVPLTPAGQVLKPRHADLRPAGVVLKPKKEVIEIKDRPKTKNKQDLVQGKTEKTPVFETPGPAGQGKEHPDIYTYLGVASLGAGLALGGVAIYFAQRASSEHGADSPSMLCAEIIAPFSLALLTAGVTSLVVGSEKKGTGASLMLMSGGLGAAIVSWW
ncbi:MAG: hypothetical protein GXP49_11100 [Deltaproteobacteria bacterium]|nr:hypothetical protein [Deltaproteobacteria bacterium]